MSAVSLLDPALLAPSFLSWVVEALVASALLMGVVLIGRAPIRRAFGPQVAYALWALPALRLLLPPLPSDVAKQVAMPIAAAGEAVGVLILPAGGTAMAIEAPGLPWGTMALAAWGLGTLAFFAFHVANHRRFCAGLLREARLVDEIDGIRVIESAAATGPLAFGTLRRFVAFPRDFAERYDADEREFALLHELGHHRARDLLSNWAALGVLALHWFNPLAWHAFRMFRCDQELANDARVLAGRSRTDAHVYACAILKAAHGGHVSAACHLHTIADLKGRMRMLTRTRPSRRRLAAGTTAVAALVATGLGLTASGTRAAAAVSTRIGDAVGVDLAAQAVPVVPTVPAYPAPATTPSVPAAPAAPAAPEGARRAIVIRNTGAPSSIVVAPATHDGSVRVVSAEGAPVAAGLVNVNITAGDCGPDKGGKTFVVRRPASGGGATVICTDRITRAAMKGEMTEADGERIERSALTAALTSLRSSRANILGNASMPGEARTEALAGIDQAIREVESDLAKVGKED